MLKSTIIFFSIIFCNVSFANELPIKVKIDTALEAIRDSHNIPALSVAIIDSGHAIYAAGFGFTGEDQSQVVTAHTLFRVASITKLFTAQAIVQLIENDKLHLKDRVDKYISHFEGSDIRIIDLITHTSGLSDSVKPVKIEENRSFEDYLNETLSNNGVASSKDFEYADLNFNVLGKVIEVVTGLSYFDYIQLNIFNKLEIKNSGYKSVNKEFKPAVSPHYNYGFVFSAPTRSFDPSFAPSEGLISSVEDLSVWVQAVLEQDERLLSKQSYREMFVPRAKTSWGNIQMGLGWQLYQNNDEFIAQHAGSITGYKSLLITYPARKRAFIILANAQEVPRWEIAKTINAILDNKEFNLPESSQGKYKLYILIVCIFLIILSVGVSRILRGRLRFKR
ncbi:MAG: beta-lactamase family protein [Arenicella sp.]|nr:beta-lactamase family protein [Arenicella sp.]